MRVHIGAAACELEKEPGSHARLILLPSRALRPQCPKCHTQWSTEGAIVSRDAYDVIAEGCTAIGVACACGQVFSEAQS